jgi:hypothetical protein
MVEQDALSFIQKRRQRQSERQFVEVLRLIIYCYNKILQEETFDLIEIATKTSIKPEDKLKYNLTHDYLRKYKKKFPLTTYLDFLYETGEYDRGNEKEYANDIAIYNINRPLISINKVTENHTSEDFYFSIECKRLKGTSKNRLYIDEGINRYVQNHYARAMPFAGMIGFIEKGVISQIKDDIDRRLSKYNGNGKPETYDLLNFFAVEKDFKYSYLSKHARVKNSPITIYHLFLDYTSIIL